MVSDMSDKIPIEVVHYQCGLCQEGYEVQIKPDHVELVQCPTCQNSSLQLLCGCAIEFTV